MGSCEGGCGAGRDRSSVGKNREEVLRLALSSVVRLTRNMASVRKNRPPNPTLLKLKDLLARGAVQSQTEAAQALGLSRQRIHQLVNEHDLDLRRPPSLVTFQCAGCGEELTRPRSGLRTYKYPDLCRSCSRRKRGPGKVTVTCQRCGSERRYPPAVVRRLTSGLCRRCWASSIPRRQISAPRVTIVCPACGAERVYRERRAAGLKTSLCQQCYPKQASRNRRGRYSTTSQG